MLEERRQRRGRQPIACDVPVRVLWLVQARRLARLLKSGQQIECGEALCRKRLGK